MASRITVVPAYGRDYKSKAQVLADWDAGKDFLIQDMSSPWDGKYINKEDAQRGGIREVNVRYKQLRNVMVIKVGSVGPSPSRVARRHLQASSARTARSRGQQLLFDELLGYAVLHLSDYSGGDFNDAKKVVEQVWEEFEENQYDVTRRMDEEEVEEHWSLLRDDFRDIRRDLERAVYREMRRGVY